MYFLMLSYKYGCELIFVKSSDVNCRCWWLK